MLQLPLCSIVCCFRCCRCFLAVSSTSSCMDAVAAVLCLQCNRTVYPHSACRCVDCGIIHLHHQGCRRISFCRQCGLTDYAHTICDCMRCGQRHQLNRRCRVRSNPVMFGAGFISHIDVSSHTIGTMTRVCVHCSCDAKLVRLRKRLNIESDSLDRESTEAPSAEVHSVEVHRGSTEAPSAEVHSVESTQKQ